MNVVVMAAGMGKRMKSALPKVLHPLAGKALLAHVLDRSRELAPGKLVVIYGHGGETVQQALGAPDLHWALQSPQLGTGHAVAQALPLLDDGAPTLILSGDVPLIQTATLRRLLAAAGSDKLGILTVDMPDPTGYGRIVRQDERITAIVEHKDADEATRRIREINTGILVVPTVPLKRWLAALKNDNAQGEYYLTDIVAMAVADGVPVVSAQPDAIWETQGVNSKQQLAELERVYQRELADRLMTDGVMLADPSRIDIRGSLSCGTDVSIDVNCVFEGRVVLGNDVRIGANCVLVDATLGDGTVLMPFTHVQGASVGRMGTLGPFSRLRPGTELGNDVHVGNFVEMKAAKVGDGSKAGHLSYVGDATVGRNVNIGAGTITCNYDGANKHHTTIGDDVFVGSDTQFVAPVTVGNGVSIAAGTTVWKDVAPGTLVLNPRQQTERGDYQRPVKKKQS
ncbi:MAG: bifunctional UDP-N-acetylglucosamine diphosphorylase/glucosamine-1-phosphate N-acetyltransferase GlmU [Burkholderiaceae bacterium]